jgi:hypothetical protein
VQAYTRRVNEPPTYKSRSQIELKDGMFKGRQSLTLKKETSVHMKYKAVLD